MADLRIQFRLGNNLIDELRAFEAFQNSPVLLPKIAQYYIEKHVREFKNANEFQNNHSFQPAFRNKLFETLCKEANVSIVTWDSDPDQNIVNHSDEIINKVICIPSSEIQRTLNYINISNKYNFAKIQLASVSNSCHYFAKKVSKQRSTNTIMKMLLYIFNTVGLNESVSVLKKIKDLYNINVKDENFGLVLVHCLCQLVEQSSTDYEIVNRAVINDIVFQVHQTHPELHYFWDSLFSKQLSKLYQKRHIDIFVPRHPGTDDNFALLKPFINFPHIPPIIVDLKHSRIKILRIVISEDKLEPLGSIDTIVYDYEKLMNSKTFKILDAEESKNLCRVGFADFERFTGNIPCDLNTSATVLIYMDMKGEKYAALGKLVMTSCQEHFTIDTKQILNEYDFRNVLAENKIESARLQRILIKGYMSICDIVLMIENADINKIIHKSLLIIHMMLRHLKSEISTYNFLITKVLFKSRLEDIFKEYKLYDLFTKLKRKS